MELGALHLEDVPRSAVSVPAQAADRPDLSKVHFPIGPDIIVDMRNDHLPDDKMVQAGRLTEDQDCL